MIRHVASALLGEKFWFAAVSIAEQGDPVIFDMEEYPGPPGDSTDAAEFVGPVQELVRFCEADGCKRVTLMDPHLENDADRIGRARIRNRIVAQMLSACGIEAVIVPFERLWPTDSQLLDRMTAAHGSRRIQNSGEARLLVWMAVFPEHGRKHLAGRPGYDAEGERTP